MKNPHRNTKWNETGNINHTESAEYFLQRNPAENGCLQKDCKFGRKSELWGGAVFASCPHSERPPQPKQRLQKSSRDSCQVLFQLSIPYRQFIELYLSRLMRNSCEISGQSKVAPRRTGERWFRRVGHPWTEFSLCKCSCLVYPPSPSKSPKIHGFLNSRISAKALHKEHTWPTLSRTRRMLLCVFLSTEIREGIIKTTFCIWPWYLVTAYSREA